MSYTELRTSEEPTRRETCEKVAWTCNIVAILWGAYNVYASTYFASTIGYLLTTALYFINIYVLIGDYNRWQNTKWHIRVAFFILLGLYVLCGSLTYNFRYKPGFNSETERGRQLENYWLWFTSLFSIGFLVASFLSTYSLYPDQLALLSEMHPAVPLITQLKKKEEFATPPADNA